MILCDIGNTTASFWEDGKITKFSVSKFPKTSEKIYFISVNDKLNKKLSNKNFINLEPFVQLNTSYEGLGIDRAMACYTIKTGLVVDAGSAITLDIISNNIHLGGVILPGLSANLEAYSKISPRLKINLNSQIDPNSLPQQTSDAVSYGIIKPILLLIKEMANDKQIYFTGGDGVFFERFFQNSIYCKDLVFLGMKKIIEENKEILC
nr:type III pantothenate kinase [Campylobacter sp.]